MKTFRTLGLMLATALFLGLYSCGGSSPKEETTEVEKEEVMEQKEAVVDTAEVVAVDSVVAEEPAEEMEEM